MADIAELLARVEAATGPDQDLAADIFEAFEIASYIPDDIGDPTASIDAAVALVEKMLPGWDLDMEKGATTRVVLRGPNFGDNDMTEYGDATCASAPLAILAAMLLALMTSPVHLQGS